MKIGDIVRIVNIENVADCVGGMLYYEKTTSKLIYDARYPNTKPPFGKKMVIVKIEERMAPNSIAVAAMNRKNDWKHWWWVPENYIKEVIA